MLKIDEIGLTLNVEQLSYVLNISKSKAYELARRADFPTIKLGKRILILKDALCKWLNENVGRIL